ncbi:MAG: hypothetical protein NDJ92_13765 [Thermoanaerobaculia bacterium]|nr:hypothetical protein [Thermoanaerobaculia bacterium]
MIVLAVMLAIVCGFAAVRWVHPGVRGETLVGEAILVGLAVPAIGLALAAFVGVKWSVGAVLVASTLISAGVAFLPSRDRKSVHVAERPPAGTSTSLARCIDALSLVCLLGYARFAWFAAGAENDFIGIWGVKARVFLARGGIDWDFLAAAGNDYAHPDYPILLPQIFSWVSLITGEWNEASLGLLYPAMGFAVLLLARSGLRHETSSELLTSLGSLILLPLALSPWIGLAEGPLVAYGAGALILLHRGLTGDSGAMRAGAVLLGLAASIKNEGITLAAAVAVAVVVLGSTQRWAHLRSLWPAAAIATPWIVLRELHGLQADLTEGAAHVRLLSRTTDPEQLMQIVRSIARTPVGQPVMWIAAVACIALFWRGVQRREVLILAVVLQQLGLFLVAYAVTPNELEWQITWSWERLVSQVALPSAYVAITLAARQLSRNRSSVEDAMLERPTS